MTIASPLKGMMILSFWLVTAWMDTTFAQEKDPWRDINLIDHPEYGDFAVNRVCDPDNPPENLFDTNPLSCWLAHADKQGDYPYLYLKLPDKDNYTLNIFPGRGQKESSFGDYATPRKLHFTIYSGFSPEGFTSETGTLYKAKKFSHEHTVFLSRGSGLQSVQLDFSGSSLQEFKQKTRAAFKNEHSQSVSFDALILKMEIKEVFPGTDYGKLCIAQIFTNDCLVALHPNRTPVKNVYLNEQENVLWAENEMGSSWIVYQDSTKVLQIADTTDDKKWGVIIMMSSMPGGRMETVYLLADMHNGEIANQRLKANRRTYIEGIPIFIEPGEENKTYLLFYDTDGIERRIWLR